MLFDKVLLQTLSTDIWWATTATYADYSAEVSFLFLAFGIYTITGYWYRHLTLYDHNNLCGGEWVAQATSFQKKNALSRAHMQSVKQWDGTADDVWEQTINRYCYKRLKNPLKITHFYRRREEGGLGRRPPPHPSQPFIWELMT